MIILHVFLLFILGRPSMGVDKWDQLTEIIDRSYKFEDVDVRNQSKYHQDLNSNMQTNCSNRNDMNVTNFNDTSTSARAVVVESSNSSAGDVKSKWILLLVFCAAVVLLASVTIWCLCRRLKDHERDPIDMAEAGKTPAEPGFGGIEITPENITNSKSVTLESAMSMNSDARDQPREPNSLAKNPIDKKDSASNSTSTSSSWTVIKEDIKHINVTPSSQLSVKYPFSKLQRTGMRIENVSKQRMMWKMKTTNPKFLFIPNDGILRPSDHVDIQVQLENLERPPTDNDRISFQFVLLEETYVGSAFDMKYFLDAKRLLRRVVMVKYNQS